MAQDVAHVKGSVMSEAGEILEGVTVKIVSADTKEKQSTTTNDKGIFVFSNLKAGKKYNLNFSSVGYAEYTIPGYLVKEKDNNSILIRMKQTNASLNDVVVIGYGSQQKKYVTGATSNVKSASLNRYMASGFANQLAGKAAGVVVNSFSAQPGTDPQIVIRGIGTLTAGRNPLVVVDGFPLSEGSSLNSINPQDIETIDILKDPASAAIYGSRSANGVILISTKKGRADALKVSFDFYSGIQERADKLEFVDAYDAALYFTESRDWAYVSKNPSNRSASDDRATRISKGASLRELPLNYLKPWLDKQPGLTNTNWFDETFRKAPMSSYNLSFSGGSAKSNYYVSANYFTQQGLLIENDYTRFSGTIRINSKLSDRAEFGISVNPSYSIQNYFENDANSSTDPIGMTGLMYPFFSPYKTDGKLAISEQIIANTPEDGALAENPVAAAKMIKNVRNFFRTFGSTYLSYTLLKGLKFKTLIGGDISNNYNEFFNPSDLGGYRTAAPKPAVATEVNAITTNYLSENTLTYSLQTGKHDLNVLAGYTFQKEFRSSTTITGSGIPDNNITNIAGASAFNASPITKYRWTQISYLSRIQYAFNGKYLLSLTARRDGSSRFGGDTKWGNFPSVTAGWVLSKENFFPETNTLNFLKLRATWGKAGNNQIDYYGSRSTVIGGSNNTYVFGSSAASGFAASTTPNSDLSWETKTSTNLGADIGIFDRINLAVDYYITTTKDLLLDVPVPEQSGFSSSTQNIGTVRNKGIELEASGTVLKLGKFRWEFSGNFATNKNEVLALAPGQQQIISGTESNFRTVVGGPIAELYGYQVTGIFKSQEQVNSSPKLSGTLVGDYIVTDIDKDGVINTKDQIPIGTYNPRLTYGFGSTLSYGNIDFSFSLLGVEGRTLYDISLSSTYEAGEGFSVPTKYYFENRYHPTDNPNGFLGQPNYGNFSAARRSVRSSTISYKDADYLRIREVQFAYNIPALLIRRARLASARIYLSANNLFTFTKYNGYNPDGTASNVLFNGQANANYPVARTWIAGININF